jgi:membrane protein implicated in regulation of membrane protease activity
VRRLLDGLRERHADIVNWTQVQFFRLWTATAVILFFGLCFWYAPELLTWWQKTVLNIIHVGSDMLPYPWSNRVEYIMINFGASIWLQFTLAIILLRVLCWPVARWWRHKRRRKRVLGRGSSR